jgi:hypothetical protein
VGKSDKMFDNVKKMTCLGVLERGERGDGNGTSLKEGGGIEMSTTVLSITRCSLSFALNTYHLGRRHLRAIDHTTNDL